LRPYGPYHTTLGSAAGPTCSKILAPPLKIIIIIIIIIIQHLYSAMESEDTEALGGARLRHVKQMSF